MLRLRSYTFWLWISLKQMGQTLLLPWIIKSHMGYASAYLNLTLVYFKGQHGHWKGIFQNILPFLLFWHLCKVDQSYGITWIANADDIGLMMLMENLKLSWFKIQVTHHHTMSVYAYITRIYSMHVIWSRHMKLWITSTKDGNVVVVHKLLNYKQLECQQC